MKSRFHETGDDVVGWRSRFVDAIWPLRVVNRGRGDVPGCHCQPTQFPAPQPRRDHFLDSITRNGPLHVVPRYLADCRRMSPQWPRDSSREREASKARRRSTQSFTAQAQVDRNHPKMGAKKTSRPGGQQGAQCLQVWSTTAHVQLLWTVSLRPSVRYFTSQKYSFADIPLPMGIKQASTPPRFAYPTVTTSSQLSRRAANRRGEPG